MPRQPKAVSTSTTNKAAAEVGVRPEIRALLSGLPEPMLVARPDGSILYANRAAMDLLGVSSMDGIDLRNLSPEPEKLAEIYRRWMRSPEPTPASVVLSGRRKNPVKCRLVGARLLASEPDGVLIWAQVRPTEDGNTRFVALNDKIGELGREISRRRDAEEQLKKQNDLLMRQTQLLESIAHGADLTTILNCLIATVEGHTRSGAVVSILLLDDAAARLTHLSAPGLPSEYIQAIDGIPVGPAEGCCGTAAYTREPVFVGDILTHPLWERYREEAKMSGMRACWSSPILSQDAVVLGTFTIYYREPNPDISQDVAVVELCTKTAAVAIQRAKLEQRKAAAENALRRTESLAAAGRLAATVAHEINNPLEAVTNLIYLARTDPEVPATVREMLETADQELARVSHIAHRTVGFYRDNSSRRRVNLSEVVEDVMQLYSRKIANKSLHLERRINGDVGVWAAEGEIRQVVSNLVANAIDACEEDGRICIKVTEAQAPDGTLGGRVLVADSGCGIARDARARIFDPFFTTKEDVGTGLGLWISKRLTEKHGGRLRFKSSTNAARHGTVFSMFIPREPSAAAEKLPAQRMA